jgi:uncharacterized protein
MTPKPVTINQPAILFRLAKIYEDGMTGERLYDATRGVWRIDPKRAAGRLALAVYKGIVKEVYTTDDWLPAGRTEYRSGRRLSPQDLRGRWEFTGVVAGSRGLSRARRQSVAGVGRDGEI